MSNQSSNRSTFSKAILILLLTVAVSIETLTIISVDNGETLGNWGPMEICPEDSRAIGYQTQNDLLDVPLYDKTAMNSIRLFCNDSARTNITSKLGDTGTWELRQNCPTGEALSSFRLRVEPSGETDDNTAVNSIQFECTDGSLLNYNGNLAGTWGNFSSEACINTGICGIQTLVAPANSFGDNTALNDVVFICC